MADQYLESSDAPRRVIAKPRAQMTSAERKAADAEFNAAITEMKTHQAPDVVEEAPTPTRVVLSSSSSTDAVADDARGPALGNDSSRSDTER